MSRLVFTKDFLMADFSTPPIESGGVTIVRQHQAEKQEIPRTRPDGTDDDVQEMIDRGVPLHQIESELDYRDLVRQTEQKRHPVRQLLNRIAAFLGCPFSWNLRRKFLGTHRQQKDIDQ